MLFVKIKKPAWAEFEATTLRKKKAGTEKY